jgi:hypothetical protein
MSKEENSTGLVLIPRGSSQGGAGIVNGWLQWPLPVHHFGSVPAGSVAPSLETGAAYSGMDTVLRGTAFIPCETAAIPSGMAFIPEETSDISQGMRIIPRGTAILSGGMATISGETEAIPQGMTIISMGMTSISHTTVAQSGATLCVGDMKQATC